ncbi:Acetyltransferase (GNAT) domain-containing protein [Geopseudomonas sagittaria]|uniref:Acetyltransferase (GNAT) domain-containing protein n=1 Tax=Geopseudomonas sagittaria TaxID=1135990 RepID=A0A1I5YCR0_9GAMM|nr:GNAT family N-acetyltransferase [Pseudomonas sagittaria]SFQ41953.1 Acetyltransferase (GNAT) domain-containing protein [Pseudomonas sagittaria]
MDIIEISGKADWEKSLSKAPRHDFYHTMDFHQLSSLNGEGDPVLFDIRLEHGGVLFPLLARSIKDSPLKDLTSVYGYPSPLIYGEIGRTEIPRFWDYFTSYLYQQGYVSLFSRCHPLVTPEILGEDLFQRSGRVVIIRLDRTEEEQVSEYRTNHKRDIRKLERIGVSCQQSNSAKDLADFVENYEATMKSLDAAPYYFFSENYYRRLLDAKSFDARIYSCTLDGSVICSGIFVFCGEFVQYHLGGTAPGFGSLAPTKLMFDTVRKDASRLGYKYFCLGGGLGCNEDSLFMFKAGFSKYIKEFRTLKIIINPDEYESLSREVSADTKFFPRYRANCQ